MVNSIAKHKLTLYYSATLFSIFFAIVGFSYNAWRLEQSEQNASTRVAAFSMLSTLSEFEQVVFASYYDKDKVSGNPRKGWGKVILLNDLASLMSWRVQDNSQKLISVWQAHWSKLPDNEMSLKLIEQEIDALRVSIKSEIKQLE